MHQISHIPKYLQTPGPCRSGEMRDLETARGRRMRDLETARGEEAWVDKGVGDGEHKELGRGHRKACPTAKAESISEG